MELVLLLGAIVITAIVFSFLVKVVRAAIGTAIMIAAIVLILQILGIGTGDLWQAVNGLWQSLRNAIGW
ncbi:MAG: hypothetical protein HC895_20460 [Leptolyngbyaceae cyanobacterium SM1_3_5]|nr:hypothetical protein [Leptolyngbyaceae cyanobacterium SM1_3_5]